MKLLKANTEKGNANGHPRWAYDDGDSIVKVLPYMVQDEVSIDDQINLINSLHSKKLIYNDWTTKEIPEHTWKLNDGERSNTFIQYRMIKVPYVFELDKNISFAESKKISLSPIYTDADLYNEHILSKYIKTNIKIFPHMNADGGHGNIFQFDIGDWIIIDWDDCFLGAKHDSQKIGQDMVREAVENIIKLDTDFTYNDLLENYKKTFDFYKKSTYNTVLESFEIDLPTMASASYKKLGHRRIY